MYPDGGIARFRVHGEGLLNPDFAADMTIDLAALENGGRITACSNMFYSSPNNLLLPGIANDSALPYFQQFLAREAMRYDQPTVSGD